MSALRSRFAAGRPRELALFFAASIALGLAYSIVDATLNNFLNERFQLSGFERSFLELPRELPGFLVVFVSAVLWFLSSRRLGVVAMVLGAIGIWLIGFVPLSYTTLVIFLFVYSLGQHLFLPIASTIGMELAEEGKTGARLGQLNSMRNLATVLGSFLVFLGFRYLHFTFQTSFFLAGVGLALAAGLMFAMRSQPPKQRPAFLTLHREYRLYYLLAVLYGARKQLFITFAPWVIVSVFQQPTQTLATLITISGVIGIAFQPILGHAIDRLGERFVLAAEAGLLVLVCFAYGFARELFPDSIAFLVTAACYLIDQILMSVNMARSTYMKKLACVPQDVQPALTTGVTIDHIFSILIALLGGLIWNRFGYQYVFLLGVGIAGLNFLAALRIRLPSGEPPAGRRVFEPVLPAEGAD